MHPVHEADALLMLSTLLSSKRRPAELAEIMAAADLLLGAIAFEYRFGESFARLSAHGLIQAVEGRYALSAVAEEMLSGLSTKAEAPARLAMVKEKLVAFAGAPEHAPIQITQKEIGLAMLAHRTAGNGTGKNLLVPKPKPAQDAKKRGGAWRKPAAKRGKSA